MNAARHAKANRSTLLMNGRMRYVVFFKLVLLYCCVVCLFVCLFVCVVKTNVLIPTMKKIEKGLPRLLGFCEGFGLASASRQPHSRLHIDETAVDVLDAAVSVLIAIDVRNREMPLLLSQIFLFDEVGVETVVRLHLAEHDVLYVDLIC